LSASSFPASGRSVDIACRRSQPGRPASDPFTSGLAEPLRVLSAPGRAQAPGSLVLL
jgi:hypothetical protein